MSITFFESSCGSVSFTFEDVVPYEALGKRSYESHEEIIPDGLVFQNDVESILRYTEDRVKQFLSEDVAENERILKLVHEYSAPFSSKTKYYSDYPEGEVRFQQGKLVFRMTSPYHFEFLPQDFPEWEEEKGWLGLFDVESDGSIILKQHLRLRAIWSLDDEYVKMSRKENNVRKMVEELNRGVGRIKVR